MEARQESLSSLRELLRRAGRVGGKDADDDYRRKPQNASDAPAQNVTAIPQEDGQAGPRPDDWSGTLDLVLRASEKLVASDERVRDLEVEVRELTESASQEMQQLRAQVADLQRQLNEADAGRRHAEDWLRCLTEAVRERFDFEAAEDKEIPAAQAS
jgi:small-conductance mechanosensitive channel